MDKEEIKKMIEERVTKHNQCQAELLKLQGEIRLLNDLLKKEEIPKDVKKVVT